MDKKLISEFRAKLQKLRVELESGIALGSEATRTVQLDQQSVGRLSRMDALQQQAMARATQERRDAMLQRIDIALTRIKDGEYGYCAECGEPIPRKRLELDPTLPTCVSCASR